MSFYTGSINQNQEEKTSRNSQSYRIRHFVVYCLSGLTEDINGYAYVTAKGLNKLRKLK